MSFVGHPLLATLSFLVGLTVLSSFSLATIRFGVGVGETIPAHRAVVGFLHNGRFKVRDEGEGRWKRTCKFHFNLPGAAKKVGARPYPRTDAVDSAKGTEAFADVSSKEVTIGMWDHMVQHDGSQRFLGRGGDETIKEIRMRFDNRGVLFRTDRERESLFQQLRGAEPDCNEEKRWEEFDSDTGWNTGNQSTKKVTRSPDFSGDMQECQRRFQFGKSERAQQVVIRLVPGGRQDFPKRESRSVRGGVGGGAGFSNLGKKATSRRKWSRGARLRCSTEERTRCRGQRKLLLHALTALVSASVV